METSDEKKLIRRWVESCHNRTLTDKQVASAVDMVWEYLSGRSYTEETLEARCEGMRIYRNVYEYVRSLDENPWPRQVTMHDIAAAYRVIRFNGGFVLLRPNNDLDVYPGLSDNTRPWYADPTDAADAGLLMASTLIDLLKKAVEKNGDMPVAVPHAYEETYVMTDVACPEHTMYDPKEYDSVEEFIEDVGSELAMFNGKPYIGPCFTIGDL